MDPKSGKKKWKKEMVLILWYQKEKKSQIEDLAIREEIRRIGGSLFCDGIIKWKSYIGMISEFLKWVGKKVDFSIKSIKKFQYMNNKKIHPVFAGIVSK